jgi:hypothetical protein
MKDLDGIFYEIWRRLHAEIEGSSYQARNFVPLWS